MKPEEAIKTLKLMQAQVEWDYPMDYAAAIDTAIEVLEKKISLSPTDFATLAICAIRYCHGRQTYMPSLVQDIVRSHLEELNDKDLSVLLRDCEWMTDFDFGDRKIDRPRWERWHEDLKNERNRRNSSNR